MTKTSDIQKAGPGASIAALARRHHGLVRVEEARACGMTDRQIQRRVTEGTWHAVHRGIYVVGGAPDTYEQRLLARLWSLGPDAVASHRAVARLRELPGFGEAIEWSRPRGRSQRRPYGMGHGSKWLPATHVTVYDGIPVTTVARTLFDLAGVVHCRHVELTLDAAIARKLCTRSEVVAVFGDLARRGRRGTTVMRALLEERGPGYIPPNSRLEDLGRRVLTSGGITDFEVEVNLGDTEWVGRVDLFFPEERLVVELDGRTYHRSLLDAERDRVRDNKLMAQGFRVLRVTWRDLKDRPDDVVAQVRQALRRSTLADLAGS